MNTPLQILHRQVQRTIEACEHPTIIGLSETFNTIPTIEEDGIYIHIHLHTWLSHIFTYEDVLDFPEVIPFSTGLKGIVKEAFDTLNDGTPILLHAEVHVDYPSEIKQFLIDMGKLKTTVQQAYTYESLNC